MLLESPLIAAENTNNCWANSWFIYLFISMNLSSISLHSALLNMSRIYNLHRLLLHKSKVSEKPPDALSTSCASIRPQWVSFC